MSTTLATTSPGPLTVATGSPILTRQPITTLAGQVVAHTIATDEHADPRRVASTYAALNTRALSGDLPLMVRAIPTLLRRTRDFHDPGTRLQIEITPDLLTDPDTADAVAQLAETGTPIVLADYTASDAQQALLPHTWAVTLDLNRPLAQLHQLVHAARDAGVQILARPVTNADQLALATTLGADLTIGHRAPTHTGTGTFTAGEAQCLNLINLLTQDPIDHAAVIGLISSDPALTMKVLHLVNSAALGMRRHVDSVRMAVVLLGPHHLNGLAAAALIGATPSSQDLLWAVLTRAMACWDLTSRDAGYTLGMLSSVCEIRDLAHEDVLERTGVSDDIVDGLTHHAGPLGPALAAVLAYERCDLRAVARTGYEPADVAAVHMHASAEALNLASALCTAGITDA